MPEISINDAKRAILAATEHYEKRIESSVMISLDNGESVNVLFSGIRNQTHWLFGLPDLYLLNKTDIPLLERWWQKLHPNSCKMVERQQKYPGAYVINIQYMTAHREMIMQVPVT